ncbi:MAG: hypothetical protein ABUS79_29890, partial [Pseudomonadota bacterium]
MEQPTSRPGGLFATIGGAMFQRAAALLGDDHAAIQTVESLFVRFVVHARGQALGDRARWLWIYRVVTSHCLRLMWASAPPDGPGGAHAAAGTATFATLANLDRERLRGLDEATQNMVVLAVCDGLTPEEVADVLGLPIKLVRRRLAVSFPPSDSDLAVAGGGAAAAAAHPSNLALDADRTAHAAHIAA